MALVTRSRLAPWATVRLADLHARMIGTLPIAGKRVCEIGPGRGLLADWCVRQGARYVGIEKSAEFVQVLRNRSLVVLHQAIPPLPLLPSPFDAVIVCTVLEALTPEQVVLFLRQAHAVLVPGGRLFLTTRDFLWLGLDFWRTTCMGQCPTTRLGLCAAVREAGFSVVRCQYYSIVPGSWMFRLMPSWTDRLIQWRAYATRRIFVEAHKP